MSSEEEEENSIPDDGSGEKPKPNSIPAESSSEADVSEEEFGHLVDLASKGNLDSSSQKKIASMLVSVTKSREFSGPYPPPEILSQYPQDVQNEICRMARSAHEHQKELDHIDRKDGSEERKRGQYIGGTIAITGLIVTAVIAFVAPYTAAIVGALDLLGLTAVFAYPRYLESRNNSDK